MKRKWNHKPKIKVAETEPNVKFYAGLALHRQGQLTAAQEAYREVLKLQPKHAEALHMLGVIAGQSNEPARALDFINQSLAINTDNAGAHFNSGMALYSLQQYLAAIDHFNKAVTIKPDYAQAYFNCGLAWYSLRQYRAAIEKFDQAIALRPDVAEAHVNRGLALNDLKQHQAAVQSYYQANALKPGIAASYFNCGLALNDLQQYQSAIENFERTLVIAPDYEYLHGELLYTRIKICDWGSSVHQLADLTQRIQRGDRATSPFQVLALTSSLPLQRKAAEIYVKDRFPPNNELGDFPKRVLQEKIRIGYFSADYHEHATAYLMAELFEQHDKNRFELFAFSFGPDSTDLMRQRLCVAFDRFLDVRSQSDKEVAQLARSLNIDIAVDLKGFTQDHRAGIFSYRAAPLQVSYLGYPGTMGADYIDYLIADPTLIPEASQQHYAEKIVYLPNSYQVNDAKRKISERVFTRQELGLPGSSFVFCCFNNNYKITPGTFDGWMRILRRVDGSVLWLFEDNPSAVDNLRREAQQRGVSPQRLVFAKRMPLAQHLARHRAANLFLDTLPYNAHTTASDALWAGLPVLTCLGEAFASRVAASLLQAIDLPELITTTQKEYEALAVELATHPGRLSAIKHKLARHRLTTPLFDTQLFTRHIEDAYTKIIERCNADLAPAVIYLN